MCILCVHSFLLSSSPSSARRGRRWRVCLTSPSRRIPPPVDRDALGAVPGLAHDELELAVATGQRGCERRPPEQATGLDVDHRGARRKRLDAHHHGVGDGRGRWDVLAVTRARRFPRRPLAPPPAPCRGRRCCRRRRALNRLGRLVRPSLRRRRDRRRSPPAVAAQRRRPPRARHATTGPALTATAPSTLTAMAATRRAPGAGGRWRAGRRARKPPRRAC